MMRILICLLAIAVPCSAQASVLTLEEARRQARGTRADTRIHQARLDRARALINKAGASRRPKLIGTVDVEAAPGSELIRVRDLDESPSADPFLVQASRPISDGLNSFLPQFRYGALLGLTWNVVDFGRSASMEVAARAEERARRADQDLATRALTAQVDAAYLAWLGAREHVTLEQAAVRAAQQRLKNLQVQVNAGSAAPSTLLQAQADVAVAELAWAEVDSEREEARLLLEETLGRALPEGIRPDPRLLDRAPAPTTTGTDPATSAWGARADAAKATARHRAAARRPVLSASALAGVRGQLGTVFPAYRAQVALQVPLWDGGVAHAEAEAARAEARELSARQDAAERAAVEATRRAQHAVKAASRTADLAEALVALIESRSRDARQRFEDGAATLEELRAIDADLIRARSTLLNARITRTRAILELHP